MKGRQPMRKARLSQLLKSSVTHVTMQIYKKNFIDATFPQFFHYIPRYFAASGDTLQT